MDPGSIRHHTHYLCGCRCRLCRTDETYSKQHILVGTEVGDPMSMGSSSLALHIEGAKKPELGLEEPCYPQKCELRYMGSNIYIYILIYIYTHYTLYISLYIYTLYISLYIYNTHTYYIILQCYSILMI